MRIDLEQINQRITIVERSLTEVKNHQLRKKVVVTIININILNFIDTLTSKQTKIMELKYPKWWPFADISPSWFVFMLLCPLVVQRLMLVMQRRRN